MEQSVGRISDGTLEMQTPGVSWGAVLAGAAAACALTLLLLSLGVGLGFAVVSPWGGRSASSTSFEIGTGLYFIVMAMISSGLGGVSRRPLAAQIGLETTEVQFRDTAHGFLASGGGKRVAIFAYEQLRRHALAFGQSIRPAIAGGHPR
jgi:hypothetical protein